MKRADRVVPERYQQQRNEARFTLLLGALSIGALFYYYAQRQLLLYGDAVAHINIARRVVDNRHPIQSYGQLGTVWLPLQHIAMLPFMWNDALWRSGIAGAIPGMVAYVLGSLAVFRLVSVRSGTVAAYLAAAIYALNPNLLYMQATAMNEPIFLAFFLWTLLYLDEFLRAAFPPGSDSLVKPAQMKPRRALEACGITMAGGALTRYDGWFAGAIVGLILVWTVLRWWEGHPIQDNAVPWRNRWPRFWSSTHWSRFTGSSTPTSSRDARWTSPLVPIRRRQLRCVLRHRVRCLILANTISSPQHFTL